MILVAAPANDTGGGACGSVDADVIAVGGRADAGGDADADLTAVGGRAGGGGDADITEVGGRAGGGAVSGVDADVTASEVELMVVLVLTSQQSKRELMVVLVRPSAVMLIVKSRDD